MKIRSGCAIGPSVSRGKETLNDQTVNGARATLSSRRSSIATEVAGGGGGGGGGDDLTLKKKFSLHFRPFTVPHPANDGHLTEAKELI